MPLWMDCTMKPTAGTVSNRIDAAGGPATTQQAAQGLQFPFTSSRTPPWAFTELTWSWGAALSSE